MKIPYCSDPFCLPRVFSRQNIHHTLYQALEWVQNSPPIFNRIASPLCLNRPLPDGAQPLLPGRDQLDWLASLVNKKGNPLLGIFYETLWQFLLCQLPESQLLANNLQVREEKNGQLATLGEYDLLYRFRKQYRHRELAIKFYLGLPGKDHSATCSPWHHWIGPGLQDRLDRKMDRLLHHQATLSDTKAGMEALVKSGIELPVEKEVLIQGRLFYPLYPLATTEVPVMQLAEALQVTSEKGTEQRLQPLTSPPERCNPDHLRGYWLTQNRFCQSLSPTEAKGMIYQIPDKKQWLNRQPDSSHIDHETLLRTLKHKKQPVYIRAIDGERQNSLHLFIVPDHWPDNAIKVSQK